MASDRLTTAPSGAASQLGPSEIAVLHLLQEDAAATGARVLMRALEPRGIFLSQASISRLLRRLDELGLTSPIDRKGRVLTPKGRALVEDLARREARATELSEALDITHVEQLLDLLRARRGLEREIVLAAVERATDADIDALERAWVQHTEMVNESEYRGAVANEFHKLLVKATHSSLFETVSEVILYDALSALDPLLFLITSWNGTVRDAPDEHRMLVDALRARDGSRAEQILDKHLSRLITEVEDFREKDRDGLFASFLSLTNGSYANQR